MDFIIGECPDNAVCDGPSPPTGPECKGYGYRKIFNRALPGEKCIIYDNFETKIDGTLIDENSSASVLHANYVLDSYSLAECSIYDDVVLQNPMVKIVTMVAAVLVSLLGICGFMICCSYCQLEARYTSL